MREDADRNVDDMFRKGLTEESAPVLGRFQFYRSKRRMEQPGPEA